jgi:hypothetical protein
MIAAIYARKSTDQQVADEQKSVTRQVAHARAYAAAQGWTVDESCIFVDDGVSGAEFANRPGYMRLLNAQTPRPPRGPRLELIQSCWKMRSLQKVTSVLACGIYRTGSCLEVRCGYGEHELLRSQFAAEIGTAREIAGQWRRAVMAKGGFSDVGGDDREGA